MPRLPTSILRQARAFHPLLIPLLGPCRTLPSAINELRWLTEHAQSHSLSLHNLVIRRARGIPLQYLLRSEFFGPLELSVSRGVLIPRPETATATLALVARLASSLVPLRILDLCTGSGAIAHLLAHLLPHGYILGLDSSGAALRLARRNGLRVRHAQGAIVAFENGDVLDPQLCARLRPRGPWDVLVANPPYVSGKGYATDTSRSVRNWEPKEALVPCGGVLSRGLEPGDEFYPALLDVADGIGVRVLWMEVGDLAQGLRVAGLAKEKGWDVEVWRDEPDAEAASEVVQHFKVKGKGQGRSVLCVRDGGAVVLS